MREAIFHGRRIFVALVLWVVWWIGVRQVAATYPDVRPGPPIEAQPGVNLYWHLPGTTWKDDCGELMTTDAMGTPASWYVVADLLPLTRDNLRAFDFAALGEEGPGLLSNSGFKDVFEAGAHVTLGWRLGDWYRLEVGYLGGYRWSGADAVRNREPNAEGGVGNLFSPFTRFGDPPATRLDYNDLAAIDFSSTLDSVELNVRRRFAMPPGGFETSWLLGLRTMAIEEQFAYHSEANVPAPLGAVNDAAVGVDSQMVGVQVGVLGQWIATRRSWIDWEIKGGIFSNEVTFDSRYENQDETGAVTRFSDRDARTCTTYLLETSVMYNYHFTRTLTFRIGYSALFLSGEALGADHFSANATQLTEGPIVIDGTGRIAYHGPTLGLVGAW